MHLSSKGIPGCVKSLSDAWSGGYDSAICCSKMSKNGLDRPELADFLAPLQSPACGLVLTAANHLQCVHIW